MKVEVDVEEKEKKKEKYEEMKEFWDERGRQWATNLLHTKLPSGNVETTKDTYIYIYIYMYI